MAKNTKIKLDEVWDSNPLVLLVSSYNLITTRSIPTKSNLEY